MTILTRRLHDRDDPAVEIPVHVFPPMQIDGSWWCRFTIGWPAGECARAAGGCDAIQALDLALRMIGTQLYTSDLHGQGRLMWLQPGTGYGFPVPQGIRDLLIGDDALFL
jgi:hypothetical protein